MKNSRYHKIISAFYEVKESRDKVVAAPELAAAIFAEVNYLSTSDLIAVYKRLSNKNSFLEFLEPLSALPNNTFFGEIVREIFEVSSYTPTIKWELEDKEEILDHFRSSVSNEIFAQIEQDFKEA